MNTIEAAREGKWLEAIISWDPTAAIEAMRTAQHPIPRDATGVTEDRLARSLFPRPACVPVGVPGGDPAEGWMVIASSREGANRVKILPLDYNPHFCIKTVECTREHTCEDDWDVDEDESNNSSCELCEVGCECDGCEYGSSWCGYHREHHGDYYGY